VTDLAEIPAKHGVTNVYADLGQVFATTLVAQPRMCAAIMGTLIKGLGAQRFCWGADAIWTGSPQWQIEGLRRLEIPADMQKKHSFAPLGPADGEVKTAVLGGNNAQLYNLPQSERIKLAGDSFATLKMDYKGLEAAGWRLGVETRLGARQSERSERDGRRE
jgi:uncharacterized protein